MLWNVSHTNTICIDYLITYIRNKAKARLVEYRNKQAYLNIQQTQLMCALHPHLCVPFNRIEVKQWELRRSLGNNPLTGVDMELLIAIARCHSHSHSFCFSALPLRSSSTSSTNRLVIKSLNSVSRQLIQVDTSRDLSFFSRVLSRFDVNIFCVFIGNNYNKCFQRLSFSYEVIK